MSKEFQEPEEVDMDNKAEDAVIIDDFNPLDEAVLEKEYTKHNVKVNPNDFVNPIPEPAFTPPPMTGGLTEEEKVKKPEEPFNPKMKELPNKDKTDAAEKVAEMIMGGYKWLNQFADNRLLFDEKKIAKLQRDGEIDLGVGIPVSPSITMSAGEFIQEYNDQSRGTITVSQEFEEETMPVLTRVLAKRGVGMTDEQYLAYLFGKDALTKVFLMNQSLGVKKEILQQLKEATMLLRGGAAPIQTATFTNNTPPPPSEPIYEPEPEPEPMPSAPMTSRDFKANAALNTDIGVNDMVNMMTGGQTAPIYDDGDYQEPTPRVRKPKKNAPKKSTGRKKK